MTYCQNCGAQINDQTSICPSCGATQQAQQPNGIYPQPYNMYPTSLPEYDSGSFGWEVLGFFLPLIGLILFLIWRKTKPASAKRVGSGALLSVISKVVYTLGILCLAWIVSIFTGTG